MMPLRLPSTLEHTFCHSFINISRKEIFEKKIYFRAGEERKSIWIFFKLFCEVSNFLSANKPLKRFFRLNGKSSFLYTIYPFYWIVEKAQKTTLNTATTQFQSLTPPHPLPQPLAAFLLFSLLYHLKSISYHWISLPLYRLPFPEQQIYFH